MTIRVIIVDDQAMVRAGFAALLNAQSDIDVVGDAADGAQALEVTGRTHPDVVLMDVRMPVMDGLEASEHLRALQRIGTLPPFPIVASTAGDSDSRRDACRHAGMDGYLSKPMDMQALADELHRVLPARPSAEL